MLTVHHAIDDDGSRTQQASSLDIDATRLRRAAAAVVVWMQGRGWLVRPDLFDVYGAFVCGAATADDVYARLGHRLTTRDVAPHRIDSALDLFGELLPEGEAFSRLQQEFGTDLERLADHHDGLASFFAKLDRAVGLLAETADDLPPIPVLAQLSTSFPLSSSYLTEVLHLLGAALALALDEATRSTAFTVGLDRPGPAHTLHGPAEVPTGRVLARPRHAGGVFATTDELPALSCWTDGTTVAIELTRLSENDRAECERIVREGMALARV
ncbi:MAG: hypothetical protein R3F61_34220 [Myxococcota bacterium]